MAGDAVDGVVNCEDGLALDGLALVVTVTRGVGLAVGLPLTLVLVVPVAGAVAPPVLVPVLVAVPVVVAEGMVGVVGDELVVHADIAVAPMTVSRPAPISLALSVSPAMVVRSLIGPPRADSFPGSGFTKPAP